MAIIAGTATAFAPYALTALLIADKTSTPELICFFIKADAASVARSKFNRKPLFEVL